MKDFVFSDPSESITRVTFRTDLIDNSGNDFTIHQITGLSDIASYQRRKAGLLQFKRRESSKAAFVAYAQANQLDLQIQNPDGSGVVVLVDWISGGASDSNSSW